MKNNKIKIFIMMILAIIVMISSKVYASTKEISKWKIDYLQSSEEGKVTISGIELYLSEDLISDNSIKIQKGDIIKLVQPVEIINNNYVKVILNDKKQGYMNITKYSEDVIRKDDKLSFKLYKGYIGMVQELPISEKGAIFVLIIAILLVILDKGIDEVFSNFIRGGSRLSIIKLIFPLTMFLGINGTCIVVNDDQYYEILKNGIGFLPKDSTTMYYILYFSTFIFIVLSIAVTLSILMRYNLPLAIFKLIEVFIIGNIFGFILGTLGVILFAFIICMIVVKATMNTKGLYRKESYTEY